MKDTPHYQPNEPIEIGVRSSVDGYLYIFSLNSQGRIAQLFPNKYDQNNFLKGGETLYLPNRRNYRLSVLGPEGLDHVIAIASRRPLEGHRITFADNVYATTRYKPPSFWGSDSASFWLGQRGRVSTATLANSQAPLEETEVDVYSSATNIESSAHDGVVASAPTDFPTNTTVNIPSNQPPSINSATASTSNLPSTALGQTAADNTRASTTLPSQNAINPSTIPLAENKDLQGQKPYNKWQAANIKDYSLFLSKIATVQRNI